MERKRKQRITIHNHLGLSGYWLWKHFISLGALTWWSFTHSFSALGKSFHITKYWSSLLWLWESKISWISKCCSSCTINGAGGGGRVGLIGKTTSGFNRLQWNTEWILFGYFGNSSSTVRGLIIRLMGKGSTNLGPNFFYGCRDCR